MRLEKGDRLEVVAVMDDPYPIEIGTRGTVTAVENRDTPHEQVHVRWDQSPSGERRSLLLVPQDYEAVRKI